MSWVVVKVVEIIIQNICMPILYTSQLTINSIYVIAVINNQIRRNKWNIENCVNITIVREINSVLSANLYNVSNSTQSWTTTTKKFFSGNSIREVKNYDKYKLFCVSQQTMFVFFFKNFFHIAGFILNSSKEVLTVAAKERKEYK